MSVKDPTLARILREFATRIVKIRDENLVLTFQSLIELFKEAIVAFDGRLDRHHARLERLEKALHLSEPK